MGAEEIWLRQKFFGSSAKETVVAEKEKNWESLIMLCSKAWNGEFKSLAKDLIQDQSTQRMTNHFAIMLSFNQMTEILSVDYKHYEETYGQKLRNLTQSNAFSSFVLLF